MLHGSGDTKVNGHWRRIHGGKPGRRWSSQAALVTVLLPFVTYSTCSCQKRLCSILVLNRRASDVLQWNKFDCWRVENQDTYENIKCSTVNFLGHSYHGDRIFGAG